MRFLKIPENTLEKVFLMCYYMAHELLFFLTCTYHSFSPNESGIRY